VARRQAGRTGSFVGLSTLLFQADLPTVSVESLSVKSPEPELKR